MMERKSKKMKVWALVAAMVAATSGYGFALTTVPDDVNVTGYVEVGTVSTSTTSTPGAGSVGEQVFVITPEGPGAVSYVYTMIELDQTLEETTTATGNVLVETNGDVTMAAGSEAVDSYLTDYATRITIDSDPASATYGDVIDTTVVAGTYDPTASTFAQVAAGVDPTTFDPTLYPDLLAGSVVTSSPGANLTMDGDFTMTGGNVSIVTEDDATTGNSASVTVNPNQINLHVGGASSDITMNPDDIAISATTGVAITAPSVTVNGEEVATEPYVDAGDAATLAAANDYTDEEVAAEAAIRAAADTAEASARAAADTTLQNNINTEAATRASEDTSIREEFRAADTTLQANINTERTQRIADVNAEEDARIAADVDLQRQIDDNSDDIEDLEDELDAVASMSAAMSALVPNDRAAGNTQISLGLGTYDGATAGALGLFHYVNDNILLNAAAAADFEGDGEVAGRAGITIGF